MSAKEAPMRIRMAPALLMLVSLSSAVKAEESPSGPRFFGQLDLFTKDDAYEEDDKVVRDTVDALVTDVGYDRAESSMKTTGGVGLRAGFFFPTKSEGVDVGWSAGYVFGPRKEATVTGF